MHDTKQTAPSLDAFQAAKQAADAEKAKLHARLEEIPVERKKALAVFRAEENQIRDALRGGPKKTRKPKAVEAA